MKKLKLYLMIFVVSLGFFQIAVTPNQKASAQTLEERCVSSGGSWEVQGTEGGVQSFGCECPGMQANGVCTSTQAEFICNISGGSWEVQGTEGGVQSFGCECPDKQLNGRCVSSQELACETSGGVFNNNSSECRCPAGERVDINNVCTESSSGSAEACEVNDSFLGIPTWYRGLEINPDDCDFTIRASDFESNDKSTNPVTIIIINVIAILSRLAGIVAVVFVVTGGFKYVLSDGDPQKTAEARKTITNALIGALIVSLAAAIVDIIHTVLT